MELWKMIEDLQGTSCKTLDKRKTFEVVGVTTNEVLLKIRSTNKERKILWPEIEETYNALLRLGSITRSEIEEKFSPRNPAYVATLLSQLPGVSYKIRPIRLEIRR